MCARRPGALSSLQPMTQPLLVERQGEVALLTLNRPEKRNALSIELRFEMAAALERLPKTKRSSA